MSDPSRSPLYDSLTTAQRAVLATIHNANGPNLDPADVAALLRENVAATRKTLASLRDASILSSAAPLVKLHPDHAALAAYCAKAAARTITVAGRQIAQPAQTPAQQLIELMADGKARTAQQVAAALNVSTQQAGKILRAAPDLIEVGEPGSRMWLRGPLGRAPAADTPAEPVQEPTAPAKPVHATCDRAREVLWDALQPDGDRDGLTVLGLAELTDMRGEAGEVLDDAGAPSAPGLVERVRWLHGELVAAQNRARLVRQDPEAATMAAEVAQALNVDPTTSWADLIATIRDRSRPLYLQLDDVAIGHDRAAHALRGAVQALRGAA